MTPYKQYIPAMRAAVLRATNSNDPDHRVGAFFVLDDGRKVGGANNVILLPFTTNAEKQLASAHAEIMAIYAAREAGWANLSKLTLVVTRQPCSQCMIAIWLSHCKRVVYLDKDESGSKWAASFEAARAIADKFNIELIKVPAGEAQYGEDSFLQGRATRESDYTRT